MAPKKQAVTQIDRAEALRKRYAATFCVCGRPKANRTPFCKADMGVLGEARAPRALLRGDLDDPQTASTWEECLAILQQKGWVKPEVSLG